MFEDAAALLSALVAAAAIIGAVRALWRRTLGRRRTYARRLARLGTNVQVNFFSATLDASPAIRRTATWRHQVHRDDGPVDVYDEVTEVVYVDPLFYLQLFADDDDTVIAFSLTCRDRRFRPKLESPGRYYVEKRRRSLSWQRRKTKSVFAARLRSRPFAHYGRPTRLVAWSGNRPYHYYEAFYGGGDALYQWYVLSLNQAGFHTVAEATELRTVAEREVFAVGFDGVAEIPQPLERFRRTARPNTYTVIGTAADGWNSYPFAERLDGVPITFGVSVASVQTLPGPPAGAF